MKLLFILLCVLLFSCVSSKMKEDLKKINSARIEIPATLNIICNNRDTLINNIFDSELKFIIYIDSANCTSCNINKMYLWEPLLKYAKMYNNRLKFYFIFRLTSKGVEHIKTDLTLSYLDYPIFIDKKGDFEKLNPHLPKNKALHTFLLNENNKVILVGNPLYNKEIEKLFYKKTQELLSK